MKYMVKDLLKQKIISAVLSIALGIVIIIARRAALDMLVKIIGGLVIAGGVAFVVIYLTRQDTDRGNLKMVLLMAAVAVVVGLLLISLAEDVVNFFPVMMGVFLILNGLSHLAAAGMNPGDRVIAGIIGAVVILFGILLVVRPGFIADALMIYIGAFFILNGFMDVFMVKRLGRTPDQE